jgi:hypothetical protein
LSWFLFLVWLVCFDLVGLFVLIVCLLDFIFEMFVTGMVGFGLHPQPPLTEMYTHEERDLHTYTELIPKQDYYYADKGGEGRKRRNLKEKKKKKQRRKKCNKKNKANANHNNN